jgi:hypothetical protein
MKGHEKIKAQEIFNKFFYTIIDTSGKYDEELAIECAISCVDEILNTLTTKKSIEYWNKVKQEIENL